MDPMSKAKLELLKANFVVARVNHAQKLEKITEASLALVPRGSVAKVFLSLLSAEEFLSSSSASSFVVRKGIGSRAASCCVFWVLCAKGSVQSSNVSIFENGSN